MFPNRILVIAVIAALGGCQAKPEVSVAVPVPAGVKDNYTDEIAVSCLYVDRCLERMEGETEHLLDDRAASIIQAAERTLPVFWGTDPKTLSAELKAKIDGYPAKVRQWMDRINEAKAEIELKSLRELDHKAEVWREANKAKSWQDWIDDTDKLVESIQRKIISMPAGTSLDSAIAIFQADQKLANEYRRRQLTEYQKNSIRKCYGFLDYTLKNTIVSDDTLNTKFEEAGIFQIDSNLLGSDARRIFDIAVARMDGLRDRRRADFFLKLSETPKWSLADY